MITLIDILPAWWTDCSWAYVGVFAYEAICGCSHASRKYLCCDAIQDETLLLSDPLLNDKYALISYFCDF